MVELVAFMLAPVTLVLVALLVALNVPLVSAVWLVLLLAVTFVSLVCEVSFVWLLI